MIGTAVALVTLVLTVPTNNAYVEGDSIFACQGGAPTQDIAWVRLWRQDVTGGMPYLFDSLNVFGKEGQEVTVQFDPGPGTHVYGQVADTAWNYSCFSEGVYLPGYVTGISDTVSFVGQPTSVHWFDINGRLLTQLPPPSSGIYFRREIWADGRKRIVKEVWANGKKVSLK